MFLPNAIKERVTRLHSTISQENKDFSAFLEMQRGKMLLAEKASASFFVRDEKVYDAIRKAISGQLSVLDQMKQASSSTEEMMSSLAQAENQEEGLLLKFFRSNSWMTEDSRELMHELKLQKDIESRMDPMREKIARFLEDLIKDLDAQERLASRKLSRKELDKLNSLIKKERKTTLSINGIIAKEIADLKKYFSLQSLSYALETRINPVIGDFPGYHEPKEIPFEHFVFVHMTNFFPKKGVIKTRSYSDYSPRNSLHFTLNGPVEGVLAGIKSHSWDDQRFAILVPGARFPVRKIKNLAKFDTYIFGNLKLPQGSIILLNGSSMDEEAKAEGLSREKFIESYKSKGISLIKLDDGVKPHSEVNHYIMYAGRNTMHITENQDRSIETTAEKMGVWSTRHSNHPSSDLEHAAAVIHFNMIPYLKSPTFKDNKFILDYWDVHYQKNNWLREESITLGVNEIIQMLSILNDWRPNLDDRTIGMNVALLNDYFIVLLRAMKYQYDLLRIYEKDSMIENDHDGLILFMKKFCDRFNFHDGFCPLFHSKLMVMKFPDYIIAKYPNQSESIIINMHKIDEIANHMFKLREKVKEWCFMHDINYGTYKDPEHRKVY